jgi:CelD/BcsL family acetyltransferase involved in cellulose biosynthesis
MNITLIAATQLDASLQATWRALQASHPALRSPYFAPEFTLAVAAVQPGVRIAVIEDGARVVGFFPHQARWGIGRPVGAPLSDHHGVVCAPGTRWDWQALLRASRLASWHFDHLPREQAPPERACIPAESPALDLSRGMAAYLAARRASGVRSLGEFERKARKLAREVGPLRFEAHTQDAQVLATVLRLKSQQCQRTGTPDFFARSWTRALVESIGTMQHPHFAGRLSALYAGDQLVGAHLGMRSATVWHWWFPVYSHAMAPYSPGAQLLLHVAQAAADAGCGLLDLGKGDDAYKRTFADCSLPLSEGWVATRPTLTFAWLASREVAWRWAMTSTLTQPLRVLRKRLRLSARPPRPPATSPARPPGAA